MGTKNQESDTEVSAEQLAKAARLTYNTIDHWSGEELLVFTVVGRKRRYPLGLNLKLCKRIRELQNEGFPLKVIRKELAKELENVPHKR